MKEAAKVLGRRLKLDTVGEATLGINKTARGAEAIDMWKNGEIDKLISYCTQDVKMTKELYDYAINNGKMKYKESGTIKELKLNTSKWEVPESSAMTFTLPF